MQNRNKQLTHKKLVITLQDQTSNDENEVGMICMQAVEHEHVNFLDEATN